MLPAPAGTIELKVFQEFIHVSYLIIYVLIGIDVAQNSVRAGIGFLLGAWV